MSGTLELTAMDRRMQIVTSLATRRNVMLRLEGFFPPISCLLERADARELAHWILDQTDEPATLPPTYCPNCRALLSVTHECGDDATPDDAP